MNIVFCSFLGADVYNCIVVFCCVYLYGMWPICLGEDQVEKGVRSGWEALYIFRGHLMPPSAASPTPLWITICTACGGVCFGLKVRRQEAT